MLIKLLKRFLPAYTKLIGAVLVFQLIQTLATLYLPTLNADIINKGVLTGDTHYIVSTGAMMIVVTLVQIICATIAVYFGAKIAMALGRDIRRSIFKQVLQYSEQELSHFGAPSLITRTTNDVQQVQLVTLMVSTLFIAAPITGVGGIILALNQDVPLSAVLLVSIPALIVIVGMVVVRMTPLFQTMQLRIDKVNQILREQITGTRVIRAFVREEPEQARFARTNHELTDVAVRTGQLMAILFPSVMLVVNISSVGVLWFGAHRVASGGMDIGALTAFLNYLAQILMAVLMSTFLFVMVPRAEVCAVRIEEVLRTNTSLRPSTHPVTSLDGPARIEFRDVSFHFPGAEEPILRNINFDVEPGMTVGIIGSTGSGKTTLLSLLPRMFDVTSGAVLINDVDIRDLTPEALSKVIGFVPQAPYLFSGTVASNLRYGKGDATDDEIWKALETAQARDFVEQMPDQLGAPIAQGGTNVSGGQRQRLTIARSLVHRPQIYLFDDSFSALDYSTDAALREALARDTVGSTVLIVGQRVSTIRNADKIIVLDEGRIIGIGTHDELLHTNETYQEIVLSQLTAEEAA